MISFLRSSREERRHREWGDHTHAHPKRPPFWSTMMMGRACRLDGGHVGHRGGGLLDGGGGGIAVDAIDAVDGCGQLAIAVHLFGGNLGLQVGGLGQRGGLLGGGGGRLLRSILSLGISGWLFH